MYVRTIGADEDPAVSLIAAMVDEMRVLYDDLDLESSEMPSPAPADFACFLVGFEDGAPICCGGLKPLDDAAVEIKRMYVTPQARRRGAGR